ncbi:probable NAD(P)H dehydrogenase subunit CRR3, chloroplastic [Vicia villosa]|uniref:probable NAD(P)H dehydrogenase subunit CRR3, chloroplastic n=1 Tax=Vicia villosa TaxID=3911 RepID=UPI00273CD0D5|nr:probable NAD(P)H dehydrogenase subunit CRR3, chloroplastic [Vicia villosa]
MFCSLSNLSIPKPIVVTNASLPQNPDSSSSSSSPQQTNLPQNQKPSPSPPNKLRHRAPQPSIMQIERALGAGSFRDGEPDLKTEKDFDVKKTTMDLFLGQAFEGKVQKRLRETGEWLGENGETRFRSTKTRKGILVFAFQWMMPIWVLSFLIASGAIKLPFSIPFLDDLLL